MTTTAPSLDGLAHALTGELALGGTARAAELSAPWNVATRVAPAAVVAARTAGDVVAAVRAAASAGLKVAAQATGHGAAEVADDTVLVVTGGLDECEVSGTTARLGAGVRWADVLPRCTPRGVVPLVGSSSGVGAVGFTTGGGLGPMARTFGLASDTVRALEVVTGDGVLRRATPEQHADLFWGVRGGKGSLGIVTAIEVDLVPLREVYGGALYFDGSDAATVLRSWRRWAAEQPESITTSVALLQLPPLPGVPPPLAGRLTVAVRVVHVGDPREGAERVAPLRGCAPVLLDGLRLLPVGELDAVHSDPVDPMPAAERAWLLRDLPDDALDALLAAVGPGSTSPLVVAELRQLGGAFARGGRHESAVSHRDAAFQLLAVGLAVPPVAAATAATCEALERAVAPWLHPGRLPNFGGGPQAYDEAALSRLRALVRRYDPQQVMADAVSRLG